MAKLDPGRLIHQAQHLVDESRALCDRPHRAIEKSKYLEKALAVSASASRRKHRKRLLAK